MKQTRRDSSILASTFVVSLCLWGSFVGCGPRRVDLDQAKQVIEMRDKAKSMIDGGDFQGPLPLLEDCLKSGLLQSDALAEVIAMRVLCSIKNGKMNEAKLDLDGLESIGSVPEVVHGLRYLYYQKSGNASKAQAELALARRINPKYVPPK